MDLKHKLKQLLVIKQGPLHSPTSPSEGASASGILPAFEEKKEIKVPEPEAPTEDEILASIEEIYFTNGSFDASGHELKKLPEILDLTEVMAERQRLRQQLQVVSKKVSDLILQNQPAYMKELERVMELQADLQAALKVCKHGRSELTQARQQCTETSLGILASYCKRQQLLSVLRSLRTIKTLQQTDVRLREMLEEENFPGAIQLCLECQKAARTFHHYKCISELASKLQDTLEMIEEHLDVALSKVCNNFNTKHYEKLQTAYALLGKTQTAMDQLHMHFTSAIHNTAFVIVLGYVELYSGRGDMNYHKKQYQELCTYITSDSFSPCLVDLCKALWEVMRSYHRIIEWHGKYDNETQDLEAGDSEQGIERQFNKQYVHQKLEHGRSRIWQDIQQKIKVFLSGTDLSIFKFDEFIRVLDVVNRLIAIGEEFCGSKSEELHESMRKQSSNYFRNYHRARMEELRIFLENEGWELCPVKNNFSILQLMEFRFLRNPKFFSSRSIVLAPVSPSHGKGDGLHSELSFFQTENNFNPFEVLIDEEDNEDVLRNNGMKDHETFDDSESDDSDVPEELKQDFVDEQTGETPIKRHVRANKKSNVKYPKGHGPILTNATLNVLRFFGRYMQMMTVLKPIAFEVVGFMTQLFDYYMYSIYVFFATDMNEIYDMALTNRLRSALKRISENLVLEESILSQKDSNTVENLLREKVLKPTLSCIVDLSSPEKLYGLSERVVAVESLIFLAEQFEYLQQYLDSLIPAPKKTFLQQFYSQTITLASELRRPVYMIVAKNAVDCEQILNHMSMVKWDIGEIMSQHSPYVDLLLRMMQVFHMRLAEVCKGVSIPQEAYNILWEHSIRLTNRTFVEGFSNARKCSNEGRALMQLDFQQFIMKLEKFTDLRPIPDKEYVEMYIKAFYFTENALEDWIKNHKEYSSKQVTTLLNCMSHINKKTRQRLLTIMEETHR